MLAVAHLSPVPSPSPIMSPTKKRRITQYRRLQWRVPKRRYQRTREAAIRAGYRNIQAYLRAMIRKLIEGRDPPEPGLPGRGT